MTSLLGQFGVDQVARVCQTLEESGDMERLARFLWSLPADAHVQAELDRHESVIRARALVAYHAGNSTDLYRLLESFNFTQVILRYSDCSFIYDTVKPFNLAAQKVGDLACKIILAPYILAN